MRWAVMMPAFMTFMCSPPMGSSSLQSGGVGLLWWSTEMHDSVCWVYTNEKEAETVRGRLSSACGFVDCR